MSFELLETIQVTQKELPPKLASRVLKAQHISSYNYHNLITLGRLRKEKNRAEEQHQQELSNLKRLLDKAYRWLPSFKRFLNMEHECLDCGFNKE